MRNQKQTHGTYKSSLIDRLIDSTSTSNSNRDLQFQRHKYLESIQMDLSNLLNTRHHIKPELLKNYPHVKQSIFTYGFPDISSLQGHNSLIQSQLMRALREVIERFEPRLSQLQIIPMDDYLEKTAHFKLLAEIAGDPEPKRIVFDTILDVEKGLYSVEQCI